MLSVSEKYLKAISADSRAMLYRVKLAGGLVLDQSRITNVSYDESLSDTSGLSLGTANSASLSFTLKDAEPIDYNGMMVEADSGIELPDGTVEYVSLGKFWVTDFSTSDDYKTVNFSCADGMYHMMGPYVSNLTYPAHIRDVTREIISQAGMPFIEPNPWPDVTVRCKPPEMTLREAISCAAGCCGKNARFNRYGELEFVWYNDYGTVIPRENQYLNGMTKLSYKPLKVKFEITGQQELYSVNLVSDGNGGITATPGENILEGDTVVLSVNPFSGYELATIRAVTADDKIVTLYKRAEGGYSFVQPDSNVTVTVSFRTSIEGPFKLTVRAYEGGEITYDASGHAAGDNYFNAGDRVFVRITPDEGKQIDKVVSTPGNIVVSEGGFAMPESDVTITVYFKDVGDAVTPYSWLQKPSTPPTIKPYWAIFYCDNPELPTCQKYSLVWFDSWSASLYDTAYDLNEYKIQFNGYYSCESKNNGNGKHEWDSAAWNGNGSNAAMTRNAYVGFMFSGADNERVDKQYCLIASNTDLYHNGSVIFEANEEVITDTQTNYLQGGMDIREVGSLRYWNCPDTFSTPLPSQKWMVILPEDGLYMTIGEDGSYETPLAYYPSTMIAMFYDSITIQKIGAVDSSSDEEFYIASVRNGRWAYLYRDGMEWGDLHELPEGALIGFRHPLKTTEPTSVYDAGNSYNFSGLLATNTTLYADDGLFMHNNACRICECASAVAEVKTFAMGRSRAISDTIYIESEDITATSDGNTIKLAGPLKAFSNGGTLVMMFDTEGGDETVEEVTISYTNPFIYEKMVLDISKLVQPITYTPAKVKHRGNPALQAGDIVTVPDKNGTYHTVLIMQQTMSFGGGMNSEISCPGKTEKTTNFSSSSPISSQIKKEVQQSSFDIEHRLAVNNALVYAALYKDIGNSEAKIASVVEWQTQNAATIAQIEQTASENEAKISLVVGQNGLVNENGAVQGSIVISAINGESKAKISADRLDIVGKELNIKVAATNITGKLTASQINADGIAVKEGTIADWTIKENYLGYHDEPRYSYFLSHKGYSAYWSTDSTNGFTTDWYMYAKNYFGVTTTGKLYAREAEISGKIIATSGSIGGCNISNGVLQIANANIGSLSVDKITTGTNSNAVTFTDITASGGSVGGWSIENGVLCAAGTDSQGGKTHMKMYSTGVEHYVNANKTAANMFYLVITNGAGTPIGGISTAGWQTIYT